MSRPQKFPPKRSLTLASKKMLRESLDPNVMFLAPWKASQVQAIRSRGPGEEGEDGKRLWKILERSSKSASGTLKQSPLARSSLLMALVRGRRRLGQAMMCPKFWGPIWQKGHLERSVRELENLVPVVHPKAKVRMIRLAKKGEPHFRRTSRTYDMHSREGEDPRYLVHHLLALLKRRSGRAVGCTILRKIL